MIAIVDYGMGNLRSVQKALQKVGADARIITEPSELDAADKIVLPGVGAVADAIARLKNKGFVEPLHKAASGSRPFLGICLGLQMLFDYSLEDGRHDGLGVIAGGVIKFDFSKIPTPPAGRLAIPHMGWNTIDWSGDCPCLAGIDKGSHVYFCHSYYVDPTDKSLVCTWTDYGIRFASSIRRGMLFATQFHPEKSQSIGLKILENFVKL